MDQPLLQLRGITKRFTAVTALSAVDFSVRAGEVHALLGENGAGKSTLIKVLTGVYAPDEGTATLAGAPIRPTSPKEAEAAGISTVYQEVNLIPALSVAENIALGRQPGRFGFVNWRAVRRHAREALARLEIACDVDAELGSLSVALQQMVAIARALDLRARLLVLDEPTASLDFGNQGIVMAEIRRLAETGLAVVFSTHDPNHALRHADRAMLIRGGQCVASGRSADVISRDVLQALYGCRVDLIGTVPELAFLPAAGPLPGA